MCRACDCVPQREGPIRAWQGLNFVAAVMLLHCDEAGAFALLSTLCTRLLPGFHTADMHGLHAAQVRS